MFRSVIISFLFLFVFASAEAQINYGHFIQKARLDLTEHRYKESISGLNVAIASRPENFEGYFLRGLAKFSLDDYYGAIADFNKTLELHPMYVRGLQYRAICNERLGNYEMALSDFQRAIDLDPFDADLFFSRGVLFLQVGNYQSAIEDYDRVLTIDNRMSLAFINRGIAKSKMKRFDEAMDDFDKAVYFDFMNPEVYFHRGMALNQTKSYDGALSDLNEAVRLDAKNPLYFFNRAVVELQMGDTVAALSDYEKVNQLDERNALTYYNRGVIYGRQGRFAEALEMFENVTLINPNNIYGFFNRSLIYCELKRWQDAESDLTKVIQLFPEYVSAWINRSVVRSSRGDYHGAESDRLTARNLIKTLTGDGEDTEKLYRKYADSTYFSRIIAFESDFVNGETRRSQIQYADVQITPFGNFVLALASPTEYRLLSKNNGIYIDALLSQLNETDEMQAKLVLKTQEGQPPCHLTLMNDDDINRVKNGELQLLLHGILSHGFFDFQQAEACYRQLVRDKRYACYAWMNLSALLMDKAELMTVPDETSVTILKGRIKEPKDLPPLADYYPAVRLLQEALKTESMNPFLWFNLGNALRHQGEYNQAIDVYSEALKYNEEMAEAYYNRALTLIFIGETKLAMADLSKAGELGLAEAYVVMKRFVKQ